MFSWPSSIRKTGELARRRTELEQQMRVLDRQVDEFRRQVSAIAGQEASLKARIAQLSVAGVPHGDGGQDVRRSSAASQRFVFAGSETGMRTSIKGARGRE